VVTMALYQMVADTLRAKIVEGALKPGDRLPTEPMLVDEYAVSRLTVRHALDVLNAEGLIERFHGRGTFVRRPLARAAYVGACSEPPAQDTAQGLTAETYVRPGSVLAERTLAGLMQVEPGTELAEYAYFSRRGRHPYSLARIYVPLDLAELIDGPTGSRPWGEEIRAGLTAAGVRLVQSSERIITRTPTQDEADRLSLPAGAPVLEIERVTVDDRGRVVEGARLVAPGDRIEVLVSVDLSSTTGGELR
jgi:GntR family transcriptional regulator